MGKESILAQSTCHMASLQLIHGEEELEKLDTSAALRQQKLNGK